MRLGLVALLLTVSLLPTVSAQVPTPPDPDTLVLLACDTVSGIEPQARDLLPACEAQEPPAPNAASEAAPPAPAAPPAASPEAAADLAADVVDRLDDIPEEPTSAPEKLQEIVAIFVDFVERLLDVPGTIGSALAQAAGAVGDAASAAGAAVAGSATSAIDGVKAAAAQVGEAIASLFDAPEAAPLPSRPSPVRVPVKAPSLELPLGQIRQVLPEG